MTDVDGIGLGGDVVDPAAVSARAFVDAIAWGEHHKVWEMLSTAGRTTVLEVAVKRGMDEEQANRLGNGTAGKTEREMFLTDLVNGLRADLDGGTLDSIEYQRDPVSPGPGLVRVRMVAPMYPGLSDALPVGGVELAEEGGEWRVERILAMGPWASE